MKTILNLAASALVLFAAGFASAQVTWQVAATTSDGSDISAVPAGQQVFLDIRVDAADQAFGLGGSVVNYDNTIVTLNVGATILSSAIFVAAPSGPGAGFGGLGNERGSSLPLEEAANGPAGEFETEFFAGIAPSGAFGDGSLDISPVTSVAGPSEPQFRIVFDVIGTAAQSTTLDIGTFIDFGDAYTGSVGGVNNTSVTVTVPEPGTIASSLAAFGTLACVIGFRRRA